MNKIEQLLYTLSENADKRVKTDKEVEWHIITSRSLITLSAINDCVLINFKTAYMEEGRPTPASLDKGESMLVKREEIQGFLDNFIDNLNASQIEVLSHKTDKAEQYQDWIEKILQGKTIAGVKTQLENTYNYEIIITIEEGEITHLIKLPAMSDTSNGLSLYEVVTILLVENKKDTDYTYQSHSFSRVLALYQMHDYPLLKNVVLNYSLPENEDDLVQRLLAKTLDEDLKASLNFFVMNQTLPQKPNSLTGRLKI